MITTVLDLFSIGIGPSSSHTVGPMRAGVDFVEQLIAHSLLEQTTTITLDTFGSLAATGEGHGTFGAILLGLEGNLPEKIDSFYAQSRAKEINTSGILQLGNKYPIPFSAENIGKHPLTIQPRHPNALSISAYDAYQNRIFSEEYYSVGGGNIEKASTEATSSIPITVPYPFYTAEQLVTYAIQEQLSISDIVWHNELAMHDAHDLRTGILERWNVMSACIERGFIAEGFLPGGLQVRRRAPELYRQLTKAREAGKKLMRWTGSI